MGLQLNSHLAVFMTGDICLTLNPETEPIELEFPNLAAFLAVVNPDNLEAAEALIQSYWNSKRASDARPLVFPHNGSLLDAAFSPPYCPLVHREGMSLEEVRESYDLCRSSLGPTPLREWSEAEDASRIVGAWVVPAEGVAEIIATRDPVERKVIASRLAIESIGQPC